MSLPVSENGAVTLSKDRLLVCLEAAWEIEAIALMLPGFVDRTDVDVLHSGLRVRCVAGRLRELANALVAGLNDDVAQVCGLGGLNHIVLICDREGLSHG